MNISTKTCFWEKALVAFAGDTDIWWLRFLKTGFKHCFIVLIGEQCSVVVDPLCFRTEVCVLPFTDTQRLKGIFEANNYKVIETYIRKPEKVRWSMGLFSCVEVVKRLLGIHGLSIVTPYKLYKYLKNTQNEKKILDKGIKAYYI